MFATTVAFKKTPGNLYTHGQVAYQPHVARALRSGASSERQFGLLPAMLETARGTHARAGLARQSRGTWTP